jgi:hypothetical protein
MLTLKAPPPSQRAVSKILDVVLEQSPTGTMACRALFFVLHAIHTDLFGDDDPQASALALAALYTEFAAELATRERVAVGAAECASPKCSHFAVKPF